MFGGPSWKRRRAAKVSPMAKAWVTKKSYAARQRSRLATGLGIELKFFDTFKTAAVAATAALTGGEYDPTSVADGNCVSCLSAPAQGDGESNRDGRKIEIKSCYVTGNLTEGNAGGQASAQNGNVTFIALVLDTQTNGQQLNSEDVYTNPSAAGSVLLTAMPLRDLQFSSRFRILDSCALVEPVRSYFNDGAATGAMTGWHLPFKLSWEGALPVMFQAGTTADIANVTDNSLHVVAFTNNSSGTPTISYNARIRFVG